MELTKFIGSTVTLNALDNGYYYRGKIVAADDDSLTLIDMRGRRVIILKKNIARLEEVR